MKRWRSYFYHILIFIIAQLAWLALLSLWIYWYISNYIIFSQVGDRLSPQMIPEGRNVFALVSGLILLLAIGAGMFLLFRRLSIQYHLTGLYDNFIANVTHELKSPLASIQLYLETMVRPGVSRAKQQEFISTMLRDTERLDNLINSILQIPALEHKKIANEFTVEEAGAMFARLIAEAREQFQLDETTLVLEGEAPCRCVADINAMRMVVHNLIDNAIKYKSGPFHMTVGMACGTATVTITFTDQGVGFPEAERKKIFDKFYRIETEDSPSVKGTGLGLFWVQEIIRYHGGTISAASAGRHKGSTFRIELPIYRISKRRYIDNLIRKSRQNNKRTDETPGK